MKEELKAAYEAGYLAAHFNMERDKMIENGTKQCPAESTFERWYELRDFDKPKRGFAEDILAGLREKGMASSLKNDYVFQLKEKSFQIAAKTLQATDFGEKPHTVESLIEASRLILQEIVKPVHRDGKPVEE